MTNKTLKEEVIKEFRSKFSNPDGLTKIGYSTVDLRPLEDFWLEKLNLYKQKILEALPKERKPSTYNELPNGAIVSLDTDAQGHNQCLSEVKQIIENI